MARCPACKQEVHSGPPCPECGWRPKPRPRLADPQAVAKDGARVERRRVDGHTAPPVRSGGRPAGGRPGAPRAAGAHPAQSPFVDRDFDAVSGGGEPPRAEGHGGRGGHGGGESGEVDLRYFPLLRTIIFVLITLGAYAIYWLFHTEKQLAGILGRKDKAAPFVIGWIALIVAILGVSALWPLGEGIGALLQLGILTVLQLAFVAITFLVWRDIEAVTQLASTASFRFKQFSIVLVLQAILVSVSQYLGEGGTVGGSSIVSIAVFVSSLVVIYAYIDAQRRLNAALHALAGGQAEKRKTTLPALLLIIGAPIIAFVMFIVLVVVIGVSLLGSLPEESNQGQDAQNGDEAALVDADYKYSASLLLPVINAYPNKTELAVTEDIGTDDVFNGFTCRVASVRFIEGTRACANESQTEDATVVDIARETGSSSQQGVKARTATDVVIFNSEADAQSAWSTIMDNPQEALIIKGERVSVDSFDLGADGRDGRGLWVAQEKQKASKASSINLLQRGNILVIVAVETSGKKKNVGERAEKIALNLAADADANIAALRAIENPPAEALEPQMQARQARILIERAGMASDEISGSLESEGEAEACIAAAIEDGGVEGEMGSNNDSGAGAGELGGAEDGTVNDSPEGIAAGFESGFEVFAGLLLVALQETAWLFYDLNEDVQPVVFSEPAFLEFQSSLEELSTVATPIVEDQRYDICYFVDFFANADALKLDAEEPDLTGLGISPEAAAAYQQLLSEDSILEASFTTGVENAIARADELGVTITSPFEY